MGEFSVVYAACARTRAGFTGLSERVEAAFRDFRKSPLAGSHRNGPINLRLRRPERSLARDDENRVATFVQMLIPHIRATQTPALMSPASFLPLKLPKLEITCGIWRIGVIFYAQATPATSKTPLSRRENNRVVVNVTRDIFLQ